MQCERPKNEGKNIISNKVNTSVALQDYNYYGIKHDIFDLRNIKHFPC